MARHRAPGEPVTPPRGPTQTALALLLRAKKFRLAAGTDRVAAHLAAGGTQVSADAAAWIGSSTPPVDAPTLSLGSNPGVLGPRSFGFLHNTARAPIAALDLPPGALPRPGRLGVVVPGRDALPDLLPLFCARDLPIAWLISVGAGDPSEALAFLAEDDGTDAIAIVLGEGARPVGLRATVGAKPTVVLGGDPLCRAVARRAGAHVVDRIGEWLALGALLGAGATLDAPVEIWNVGGGEAWLKGELARYGVTAPLRTIDERDPRALSDAIAGAQAPRLVVVVGAGVAVPAAMEDDARDRVRLIAADTRQPEQVSRLIKALGAELSRADARPVSDAAPPTAPTNTELAARVRAECEGALSDHDAKRLLKAWGLRVTRQGPTGTPTGAVKLARTIGLPAVLVRGDDERLAETLPEVRRIAALLLEAGGEAQPSVMVRERYADQPRARLRVGHERGVGMTMKVGDAIALLPLDVAEAERLARHAGIRRIGDQRALADVLRQIAAAALTEHATLELELFLGGEPVIVAASGQLRRDAR